MSNKQEQNMAEVAALFTYPVKSLRGIELKESSLAVRGLQWDRNWMVTDAQYKFVTQRQIEAMATIEVELRGQALILKKSGTQELQVPLDGGERSSTEVRVWQDDCLAFDEGEKASQWLSSALGQSGLRLVRFAEERLRQVKPEYLKGEEANHSFADQYPILVTSEESLAALNEALVAAGEKPISMSRFRPNLVLKGLSPFAEDTSETLEAPDGSFGIGLRKPCQRCKVISIDQKTGEIPTPKEPLRTLVSMDKQGGEQGPYFGQLSTLTFGSGARIEVGQKLLNVKSQS